MSAVFMPLIFLASVHMAEWMKKKSTRQTVVLSDTMMFDRGIIAIQCVHCSRHTYYVLGIISTEWRLSVDESLAMEGVSHIYVILTPKSPEFGLKTFGMYNFTAGYLGLLLCAL